MSESNKAILSPTVLATNLKRLMDATPSLRTQKMLATASGVSQTAISLMKRPADRAPTSSGKVASPKLAEVEMVAKAFQLEVWQLLIDPAMLAQIVTKALSSSPSVPASLRQTDATAAHPAPTQEAVQSSLEIITKKKRRRASDTFVENKMPKFVSPLARERLKLKREVRIRTVAGSPSLSLPFDDKSDQPEDE